MGLFVYGPCSFVGTFLLGLAVVAAAGYLITVPPDDLHISRSECVEAKDPTGTDELEDEWAVYQALIKEERLDRLHILIEDDSLSDHLSTDDSPIFRTAGVGAIIDYRYKNRESHSLKGLFADKASFIATKEIESFPDDASSWSAFRRSHPHAFGILSLSCVGFDHDHTEAIVSFVYSCDSLCGWSDALKFRKIDGKWQKADGPVFGIYD